MKKIIIMSTLALLIFASSSMAAALAPTGTGLQIYGGVTTADVTGTNGVLIGKLSKGVAAAANYTTTGYAMVTKHTSGSKGYGTAHDSTAIYFLEAFTLDTPGAADNTAFATAWTAM